jgi:hypothetical protein
VNVNIRRTILGSIVGIGLVAVAVALAQPRGEGFPPRAAPARTAAQTPPAGTELIAVPIQSADKGQLLAIVAPRERVLCVYHIDPAGKIALKSVRNIQWDLQYPSFNTEKPLPEEVRAMVEQK